MTREFYGATVEAQRSINKLLSLPASGREQDWEFELADPNRLGEILMAASANELSFEEKCALSLLIVASIEEASELEPIHQVMNEQAKGILRQDADVLDAMKFYWIEQGRATNEELVREMLL